MGQIKPCVTQKEFPEDFTRVHMVCLADELTYRTDALLEVVEPVAGLYFSIAFIIPCSHFSVESYPIPFNRTTPLASTIQFCGMPDTSSVSRT